MFTLTLWIALMILSIVAMIVFTLLGIAYPQQLSKLISGLVFGVLVVKYIGMGLFYMIYWRLKRPPPPSLDEPDGRQ